ncbi:astacin-like metalloprotease toxin 5 [Centruroides vittatus]|uniref:astacin-like metalloprotease toxin 5 n=1 Tax=Centruroides vittatus TaxID=120091 RepID=UPI00350FD89C
MMHFERYTCVRFVQRTNEKNYVRIFKGPGCFSKVGRNKGEQVLSLAKGCWNHGTIVHELNHVVGFYHEQNRPDRDEYLKVFWENIEQDMEAQFVKFTPHEMRLLNEFDYNSVMLYGERFFSKDGHSRTLEALKPGVSLIDVSSKPGLSKMEKKHEVPSGLVFRLLPAFPLKRRLATPKSRPVPLSPSSLAVRWRPASHNSAILQFSPSSERRLEN